MTLPTEGWEKALPALPQPSPPPPSQIGGDLGRGQGRPGERDNTLSGGCQLLLCGFVYEVEEGVRVREIKSS